jgi:serine/threonine protein kinase
MLSFKGKSRPTPGQSLVDANPIVKLVDFGLAKMLGEEHSAAKTMLGTPQYIAPEVLLAAHDHSRSYGFPVDCWSVGVVLYLVLAGRFPFEVSASVSTTTPCSLLDALLFSRWSGLK